MTVRKVNLVGDLAALMCGGFHVDREECCDENLTITRRMTVHIRSLRNDDSAL